jgi:hypothetical protein
MTVTGTVNNGDVQTTSLRVDVVLCPATYNSTLWLWHTIPNVGQVKFWFYPPMTKIGFDFIEGGKVMAKYSPVLAQSEADPSGNTWLGEGPVKCRCIEFGPLGFIKAVAFEGTVWRAP